MNRLPLSFRPLAVVIAMSLGAAESPAADPLDYSAQVRPILAEHCFLCHGPAEEDRKSGLRLDLRDAAIGKAKSGKRAIVPGDADASELVRRVFSDDPDVMMPPPEAHKPLSDAERATLRRWVEQGAEYNAHWAYRPIVDAAPPAVRDQKWPIQAIDRFVLAKLDAVGVEPSPEADRYTLIRRLSYDLIGLPPTPEEIDAYVADTTPDAYERVVDRLLASPHFGERWGRHWLDKARYADSDGYERDHPRPTAWRYRDWVIDAFNSDMPIDRFTIEQLAGDLLPRPTPMQKLATAFHRQTLTNSEGGVDQEEFRNEAAFDRTETTGAVWLGLTVGCARCHTHKYDPITHHEYYGLFAFFNSADESNMTVPISDALIAPYEAAKAEHDARLAEAERSLSEARAAVEPTRAEWEAAAAAKFAAQPQPAFHPLAVATITSSNDNDEVFDRRADGSYLVSGAETDTADYIVDATADAVDEPITGIRIEVLPDRSLPAKGPGRADGGNFILSEVRVYASGTDAVDEANADHAVKLSAALADFSQAKFAASAAIDGSGKTGWGVRPQIGSPHWIVVGFDKPLAVAGRARLRVVLEQNHGNSHTIGRFRITAMTGPMPTSDSSAAVREALAVAEPDRTPAQRETIVRHRLLSDDATRGLLERVDRLRASGPATPYMKAAVLSERDERRATHVLHRGDFRQPTDPVLPAVLDELPPLAPRSVDGPADRLDLARWLVSGHNPLPPRVIVNDIWLTLFGDGLVRTPNDFGVRGEPPTHPALLDHLAARLVADGWSRKRMIRSIVTSATYRQSSAYRPELAEIDPQNRLIHRQNRFRVEAEIVRDLSLAASGLLATKVGGPSVFPPMPAGVAELSYNNKFRWEPSQGADRYRRGMYTFFKRTAPHPDLVNFDCPDALVSTIERNRSNTAPQALQALNGTVAHEAAQALAKRAITESGAGADAAARITRMFRLTLARSPHNDELRSLALVHRDALAYYTDRADEAAALAGAHPAADTALADNAALIAVARVLLNLDEFITRP